MSKRMRQQAIKDIVGHKRVPSQAALARELKEQGYDVTQATLSRDIAELELVKSKDGYLRREDAGGTAASVIPDPEGTLRRLVIKVQEAANLVLVRTPPGSAHPVAIALEEGHYEQVIGTLGGDDTCLVITPSTEDALEFKRLLLAAIQS
jgi:transcriptional regulator of arginine metabolism